MLKNNKIYSQNNKSKIKYYSENTTDHKQVIISGVRNNKSKYKIICDEGIQNLIKQLNKINCITLWSCQGDSKITPYVIISGSNLSKTKLLNATHIISKYWKKYFYIYETITCNGDIGFYAYTKEKCVKRFKDLLTNED